MDEIQPRRSHGSRPRPYRCFLIRCWQEETRQDADDPAWRFTVHEAATGVLRRSFPRIEEVELYLETELGIREKRSAEESQP